MGICVLRVAKFWDQDKRKAKFLTRSFPSENMCQSTYCIQSFLDLNRLPAFSKVDESERDIHVRQSSLFLSVNFPFLLK